MLPVIQRVLGGYIQSRLTSRSSARTRAEMVAAIRQELQAVTAIRDDVNTLKVAMQELDVVVRTDRTLSWRKEDDPLEVVSVKRLPPRKQITVQKALADLHATIAQRRGELGLPIEGPDWPIPHEMQTEQIIPTTPVEIEPVTERSHDIRLVPPHSKDSKDQAHDQEQSLRAKILGLQREVAEERRRRVDGRR